MTVIIYGESYEFLAAEDAATVARIRQSCRKSGMKVVGIVRPKASS